MDDDEIKRRVENLETRLRNTETALIALWSLTKYTFPQQAFESVDRMMEKYFESQVKLGGFTEDAFFE